jgi:hypothetical protein
VCFAQGTRSSRTQWLEMCVQNLVRTGRAGSSCIYDCSLIWRPCMARAPAALTQLAQKNKTACDMKHFCSLISSNAKAPIEGPYAYKQRLHGSYMHTTACLCDVCAGLHSSRKKWHAQGVARAHTRVVFQSSDYNYFFFKRSQTTAPRGGTT